MIFITLVTAFALTLFGCEQPNSGGRGDPLPGVKSGVWFETAYAEWNADSDDDYFTVRYRETGDRRWFNVDAHLVRKINSGTNRWRVDILGLKNNGNPVYEIQILANGDQSQVQLIENIRPVPFDRQGYAFAPNPEKSINRVTGGYNADGTVQTSAAAPNEGLVYTDDATIVYLTHENMNQILQSDGVHNNYSGALVPDTPDSKLIIRVVGKVGRFNGTVNANDKQNVPQATNNNKMYNMIKTASKSNITIEGIGPDASIEGWGIEFNGYTNVEVRNLTFHWSFDDALYFNNSTSFWSHNNTFGYGQNRLTSNDMQKGDGATDVGNTSTNFTISYNKFVEGGKTALMGGGSGARIGHGTLHHNWFLRTQERTPRVRNGWIHIFNNLYDNVGGEPGGGTGYGIGAGHRANIVSEGNTFIHTYRPYVISGSPSSNAAGPNVDGNINTLSADAPGIIITSLYAGTTPSLSDLTGGRTLIADSLDAWSKGEQRGDAAQWYFPEELTLVDGPSITNNLRGVPGTTAGGNRLNYEKTYEFVPFHVAISWQTDGQSGGEIGGPANTFTARAKIGDTLSNVGVQSAADGAARVRHLAGVMPAAE